MESVFTMLSGLAEDASGRCIFVFFEPEVPAQLQDKCE